jgi:SAM-dependent methyltransferase
MNALFYDGLAPYYHLLYGDWDRSVVQQGEALARLLRERDVAKGDRILDAACGIGTQTIGLIAQGYAMTASDISPGAIARLRAELLRRGLNAAIHVDDIRVLRGAVPSSMAAVIACDNSLPHLLTDGEILSALQSCYRSLRPGGAVVVSLRDYAAIDRVSPDVRPYGLRREGRQRFLAVQVWEWEGDQYDLSMYLTSEQSDGVCKTQVLRTRYYAITIDKMRSLLEQAGFVQIERRDDVLFQPVLCAQRPG